MPRFVAFLRGVSPTNANMAELKRCFESAGFTEVKTVLSSGNVVFTTQSRTIHEIERRCEDVMESHLGRSFSTIVRSVDALEKILAADPFARFKLGDDAKRVVTFLRTPRKPVEPLPIEQDGASVLTLVGQEVYSAYVRSPQGPVFMTLIERAFGKDVTTRTMETVKKCVKA